MEEKNIIENILGKKCLWYYNEGECWVDMPDSKYICNGICNRCEERKEND